VDYEYIQTADPLRGLCDDLASASVIGYDTEFVSEYSYRPDLCLIQVAADRRLAVIDTRALPEIGEFWAVLADAGHQTIVHSGREEFRFCVQACGRRPSRLLDTQIAAGLIGMEYPASYAKLLARLVGRHLAKGETRTDWRRRPLSRRQIEYALQDVVHLEPMRDRLMQRLNTLGRSAWLDEEMQRWQDDQEAAETREHWRRVGGLSGLTAQALAVVRELWQWREAQAARRNCPARRVLRDDLIVELARCGTADVARIRAVRGLDRGDLQRSLNEIAQCVERAMGLPPAQWPGRSERRAIPPQVTVLSQFLATTLAGTARAQEVAPALVGTVQDVAELVAYRLGVADPPFEHPPRLASGWRAVVVGQLIDDLLAGRLAIRIRDPLADNPLVFDPVSPG